MMALIATARGLHIASLMTIVGGSAWAALLRLAGLPEPPAKAMRILFAAAAPLAMGERNERGSALWPGR